MSQPAHDTSVHVPPSKISLLAPTDLRRIAQEIAGGLEALTRDTSISPETAPEAWAVGSFALDPSTARDLDFELRGVSWNHLQRVLPEHIAANGSKLGGHTIAEVKLTVAREDGVIPQDDPRYWGNAFYALRLTLEDGRTVHVGLPTRVTADSSRYNLSSVTHDPTMSIAESLSRRDFAHAALAVRPTTGDEADPYNGRNALTQKKLILVNQAIAAADPLTLYRAASEMVARGLSPDWSSLAALREMAKRPLADFPPEKFEPNRLKGELMAILLGPRGLSPSNGFDALRKLGALERDVPQLAKLRGASKDDWMSAKDHHSEFGQAMAQVSAAWKVATAQEGWSPAEKAGHVLARLAYELTMYRANDSDFDGEGVAGFFDCFDWKENGQPIGIAAHAHRSFEALRKPPAAPGTP